MNHFYGDLVPRDECCRVEALEPFDEYEEWHLKCSHYMVVVATNNSRLPSVLPGKCLVALFACTFKQRHILKRTD